jgi:hypothetical protein
VHQAVILLSLAGVAAPSNQFPWWQATAGIIGIPVAVATLIGSLYIIPRTRAEIPKTRLEAQKLEAEIRKTRLEAQKLELEIEAQGGDLVASSADNDPTKVAETVAESTFEIRKVQSIILRAILLYLILNFWRLIQVMFPPDLLPGLHILALSFGDFLSIAYWVIFVAMGWQLLLDTLYALGIDVPRPLRGKISRWAIVLLVTMFLVISAYRRESLSGL